MKQIPRKWGNLITLWSTCCQHDLQSVTLTLISWPHFIRLLHYNIMFFLFPYFSFLEASKKLEGAGGIRFYLPEVETVYINYLAFFCKEDLFLLPFSFVSSFMCWYQYGFTHIYFTCELSSSTILFIFLHRLFQLWPLEALSGWLLCPFAMAFFVL